MKIHFDGSTPEQFGCTYVTCTDLIMSQILNSVPGSSNRIDPIHITNYRTGTTSYFEWMFRSGAKLKVGREENSFYIFGYSQDGRDALAAIDELKMLNEIRLANLHVAKAALLANGMFKSMGTNLVVSEGRTFPRLRCESRGFGSLQLNFDYEYSPQPSMRD